MAMVYLVIVWTREVCVSGMAPAARSFSMTEGDAFEYPSNVRALEKLWRAVSSKKTPTN